MWTPLSRVLLELNLKVEDKSAEKRVGDETHWVMQWSKRNIAEVSSSRVWLSHVPGGVSRIEITDCTG